MESAIYVVATPIGNLADISLRALEVLKGVALIAAEDTRHTRRLLEHYEIRTRMTSLHEHNEVERAASLLQMVLDGGAIALVSDAGTPLISDPGHVLVDLAKTAGVKVIPIPGPSALTAALSVSGIPCGKFVFEGFLPAKQKAKADVLLAYRDERKAVVFYESPHRILNTLETMAEVYGDRQLTIARELTKRFEMIRRGTLPELLNWVRSDPDQQKGEFVLILQGSKVAEIEVSAADRIKLLVRLLEELPPKKASAIVVDLLGGTKREMYEIAVQLKSRENNC